MAKLTNETNVLTGVTRASYAHVFEPRQSMDGGDPKYQITLLIPKTDTETIGVIEQAIENAKKQGISTIWGGKAGANIPTTFLDGDESDNEEAQGHMILRASSKTKPGIVKKAPKGSPVNVIQITDPEDFYSGCYCRATVNIQPYNFNGKKGITAYLNNLLFVKDGEPFAGKRSAESDFGDVVEDMDDVVEDDVTGTDLL